MKKVHYKTKIVHAEIEKGNNQRKLEDESSISMRKKALKHEKNLHTVLALANFLAILSKSENTKW